MGLYLGEVCCKGPAMYVALEPASDDPRSDAAPCGRAYAVYETLDLTLEPGESVLFFTDELTEASTWRTRV